METILYIAGFALLVALVFYFWITFSNVKPKHKGNLNRQLVLTKWNEIEHSFSSGNVQSLNNAVMEADKIFDHVLKSVTGETNGTMADRLKLAKDKFSNYEVYQDVWEAHKTRNKLAHEMHAEVLSLESKRAIEKFRKGLKDLRIL